MLKQKKKKIAFVLFSDPMIYPPTMNAAAILAEHGCEVDIVGVHHKTGDHIPAPDGTKFLYQGHLKKGIGFRFDFIKFCFSFARLARSRGYDWIFSYNMTGAVPGFLGSRVCGSRFLYHVHDITIVKKPYSFYSLLKRLEYFCARKADVVSFPQQDRADLFAAEAKLARQPLIVMNGPRLNWASQRFGDPEVIALRKRCGRVVLYQGGLNWKRGLRQVLESMPMWQLKAGLCLLGNIDLEPSFPEAALRLAASLGVRDRVLVRTTMPYLELSKVTQFCDVGLGVMATPDQNQCINICHLAGASNKLVEYMACDLPVVVPNTGEYEKFIGKLGLGVLVDASQPESIAEGINELLGDAEKYKNISEKARAFFRDVLNYDQQFLPILKLILGNFSEQK